MWKIESVIANYTLVKKKNKQTSCNRCLGNIVIQMAQMPCVQMNATMLEKVQLIKYNVSFKKENKTAYGVIPSNYPSLFFSFAKISVQTRQNISSLVRPLWDTVLLIKIASKAFYLNCEASCVEAMQFGSSCNCNLQKLHTSYTAICKIQDTCWSKNLSLLALNPPVNQIKGLLVQS